MIFTGGWEPLSFRKRCGYGYADEERYYYGEEFSDAALEEMVELGCSFLVLPFAKGFGREATRRETAFHRDVARRAHARGLRVGLYIRCDFIVPETMRADYPEVDGWTARGLDGTGTYGPEQQFRRKVSFAHPSTVRRLEDLFREGIRDFGADLFHLDGFHFAGKPEHACRGDLALRAYREWLHARFPDREEAEGVFGAVDLDALEPPALRSTALGSPVSSMDTVFWYRFLWDYEFAMVRHIRHYLHDLAPDAAVTINPYFLSWAPYYRRMSQWIERYFAWFDGIWLEDHEHFRVQDGRIVSRATAAAFARESGIGICNYHWYPDRERLEPGLAFSCASNGLNLSCLGFTCRYMPSYRLGREVKKRYARWVRDRWVRLGGTLPAGDTALLWHGSSMAWNSVHPYRALHAMSDALVAWKIPYRVVGGLDAESLRGVRTLILADMECLSDGELDALMDWVREGGRLFFTRRSATHDENRLRRPENGIRARVPGFAAEDAACAPELRWYSWMPDDFPEYPVEEYSGKLHLKPALRLHGGGVVGFWPRDPDPSDREGLGAFLEELHGPRTVRIRGPERLYVSMTGRHATGELFVHLINALPARGPIDVDIEVAPGSLRLSGEAASPDGAPPAVTASASGVAVRGLACYVVVPLIPA